MSTAIAPELIEREVQEFTSNLSGGTVDMAAGIVRGVKILGSLSTNGREYTKSAMQSATSLYEGAPVYVDHTHTKEGRSYRDRFGVTQNISYRDGGLWGDLHYNPKHAVAEQFAWDVQNNTPRVGFSHTVLTRSRVTKGKEYVEQIARVLSVDLVSNPATTSTVFEQTREPETMATEQTTETAELTLRDATAEQVKVDRPRLYDEVGEQWAEDNIQRLAVEADRHLRSRIEILIKENEDLRSEILEAREAQEKVQRRMEVDHRMLQSGIARNQDTKLFRESLYEASDLHGMERVEAMIQDRKCASGRPVSREQGFNYSPVMDGSTFAQSVRR